MPIFASSAGQNAMFRYATFSERATRVLLVIAFFYVLLNGSPFNLLNGIYLAIRMFIFRIPEDTFWAWVGVVACIAGAVGLFAFMERRWKLARSQTNVPLLLLMTLTVSAFVGILVAIVGHAFDWTWSAYWSAFQWTWQIAAGYFVGAGLNWSIVDRQIAGVQATDHRAVGQSGEEHVIVDDVSDVVPPHAG